MYCPACGKQNEDNAVQCVGCGQNLSPAAPVQPVQSGSRPDIPTYLVQSILVTLFCCQMLGIVAIVFAALTTSKVSSGDYAGAMDCSNKAKMWCWIAFGLGLAAWIIWGLFMVLGAGLSAAQGY